MSLVAYDDSGSESDGSNSPKDDLKLNITVETNKKKREPIKILAPSLSRFKDLEFDDEPELKKAKLIEPKGCGLIGLLPQPRRISNKKTTSFVPHTLTKTPSAPVPSLLNKQKLAKAAKELAKKSLPLEKEVESDDEDNLQTNSSSDFFSLESSEPLPTPSEDLGLIDFEEPIVGPFKPVLGPTVEPSPSYEPEPDDEISALTKKLPYELKPDAMDQKVLRRLKGKGEISDDVEIIDVYADRQKTDPSFWLRKQISIEEKPKKKDKKDQPSVVHKRKHQITYLAHEAKEREVELKNAWATNRNTRRQTQQKYGF